MQTTARLNSFTVDYRRHRRDDPALSALALAADRALSNGVPSRMPAPPIVEEQVA
jgi:hypothetical protein